MFGKQPGEETPGVTHIPAGWKIAEPAPYIEVASYPCRPYAKISIIQGLSSLNIVADKVGLDLLIDTLTNALTTVENAEKAKV